MLQDQSGKHLGVSKSGKPFQIKIISEGDKNTVKMIYTWVFFLLETYFEKHVDIQNPHQFALTCNLC